MTTEKKLIIVGVVALCGLIAFMIWYGGTTQTINDDPIYGQLVGKKYETKLALYILQFQDTGKVVIKIPGSSSPTLDEIKQYPYETFHYIIHKVIPKGNKFTISNVVVTKKPFRGVDIWIKAKFDDEQLFKGEIDVSYISDYSNYREKMDPEYVREITTEKEAHYEK